MLFNIKNLSMMAALVAGLAVLPSCSQEQSEAFVDKAMDVTNAENTDVFNLRVGICFDEDGDMDQPESEISSVPFRDCTAEHDYEVYHSFNLPESEQMPMGTALDDLVDQPCIDAFAGYVGTNYDESKLEISMMTPSSDTWEEGDREVLCIAFNENQEKLTETIRDSKM